MKDFSKESGIPVKMLNLLVKKGIISFHHNIDSDFTIVIALRKIIKDMELVRAICMCVRKDRRQKLLEYPMSNTERYILQEYLAADRTVRVKEMQAQVWEELRIKTSSDYIKRIGKKASNIKMGVITWPSGILTPEELKDRYEEGQRIKSRNKRLEESERIIF